MYSIANLSLNQICFGLHLKVKEPEDLWKSLHREEAFGSDYFISIVEKEYSHRFVGNLDKFKEDAILM